MNEITKLNLISDRNPLRVNEPPLLKKVTGLFLLLFYITT